MTGAEHGFDWSAFWAAGFGAAAAFALEAVRRWRERCQAEVGSVNQTILTLGQMFEHLGSFNAHYEEIERQTQKQFGRSASSFEILPLAGVLDHNLRVSVANLGFLTRSHSRNLIHRIARVERTYLIQILNEQRRSTVHEKIQDRLEAKGVTNPATLTQAQLQSLAGPALYYQLGSVTAGLKSEIPACMLSLAQYQGELTSVGRVHFPTQDIVTVELQGYQSGSVSSERAARWRRLILWIRYHKAIVLAAMTALGIAIALTVMWLGGS